jgi:hypothetical protein
MYKLGDYPHIEIRPTSESMLSSKIFVKLKFKNEDDIDGALLFNEASFMAIQRHYEFTHFAYFKDDEDDCKYLHLYFNEVVVAVKSQMTESFRSNMYSAMFDRKWCSKYPHGEYCGIYSTYSLKKIAHWE